MTSASVIGHPSAPIALTSMATASRSLSTRTPSQSKMTRRPEGEGMTPNLTRAAPRLTGVPADQVGRIELVPDEDGRRGVTVMMDGSPQSYVDLADPGNLGFEYIAHLAAVIDTLPAGPLAITHVGGAGLTLARYVNAERPGSPQIVLEPDAELTELVLSLIHI